MVPVAPQGQLYGRGGRELSGSQAFFNLFQEVFKLLRSKSITFLLLTSVPKNGLFRPLRVPAAAGPLQPVSAPSVLLCAQSVCPASNLFLSIQSHLLVAEPQAAALFPSVTHITDPCPLSPAIYPILSPHLQQAPFRALPAAHVKSACCEEWAAARPKVLERNPAGNSTHEFYFTYPSGATFKNHRLLQPPSAGSSDTNSACISRRLSASHLGESGICFLNFVLPFWSCSRCAAAYAPPGTHRLSSKFLSRLTQIPCVSAEDGERGRQARGRRGCCPPKMILEGPSDARTEPQLARGAG